MLRNIASKLKLMTVHKMAGKDFIHPMIEANPPKMHLFVRSTDGKVFNPISNMYDEMPLGMFFACGWFPAKIAIKQFKHTESLLTIELDMEFYGDRACRIKIPDYIWPATLIPCHRGHCPHVLKANQYDYLDSMTGFNANYGW